MAALSPIPSRCTLDPSKEGSVLDNPVPWPDGARCAAAITFDLDADSLVHVARPADSYKLNLTLSLLNADEVAIPRAARFLQSLEIRGTFFVTGWVAERYPRAVETVVAAGHEVGNHGYLHELPNTQSREAQADDLARTSDAIERLTGQRPAGWRAPWGAFANESPELLAEAGFRYDSSLQCDVQPFLVRGRAGDVIELPIELALDDWPHHAHVPDLSYTMPIKSPQQAFEVYWAELEGARACGGVWIPILHPHITGRPSRLLELGRTVERIRGLGDVWIASLGEIATHVRACIDDGRWSPRVLELPWYDAPPAAFAR
jgi:peptidoglycan/xylan/chitin deacetylase (PgdA/CDA1 family)